MSEDLTAPVDPRKAREQAAEYLGFLSGWNFDLGDGQTWHLPNQTFFTPAMSKRHRSHQKFMKQGLDLEDITNPITGTVTKRPKVPHEYQGHDVDEHELLCIALMGEDADADREAYFADGTVPETYARFLAAGGVPGQIQFALNAMSQKLVDRARADSKSR